MSLLKRHVNLGRVRPTVPAGAVITITAASTVTVISNRTPIEGNLLYVALGGGTTRTITSVPSGWNLIGSDPTGGGCIHQYYKVAGAGESNSYTWNFSGTLTGAAVIIECENTDDTPISFVSANDGAASTSHTISGLQIDGPWIIFTCITSITGSAWTATTPGYTATTANGRLEMAYAVSTNEFPGTGSSNFTSVSKVCKMTGVTFRGNRFTN